MDNISISLCMIVKNEEKFLDKCLSSVVDIVDEMIIVDTGSTDNTIDIAKKFNAKVFNYEWNGSFADARNFSLSKATKDWILVMDADDVFEESDKVKFKGLLNTTQYDGYYFNTVSYIMENNDYDFVYNYNIRLIKNIKDYEFVGKIHEQICHKHKQTDNTKFKIEDITIHHYGYLPSVVDKKNKRERNMPLIQSELDKNPNNPFHNFNLGNEYLALGNLEKALQLYNTAYNNMDTKSGYASKLVIKRICCLIELGDYDTVINEINDALKIYPSSCDLYFYKAYTYQKQRKYTLAIKSFNKCVYLGESKSEFLFLNGCESFRSYFALGNIYYAMKDYEEALSNFEKSIDTTQKNINPLIYYKLALSYEYLGNDKEGIFKYMEKYFDLSVVDDLILFSLVLSNCNIYDYALELLIKAKELENSDRVYIEISKILIYTNRYKEAIDILVKIPNSSTMYDRATSYIVIAKILSKTEVSMEEIENILDVNLRKSLLGIYLVLSDYVPPMIKENTELALKESIRMLEIILKSKDVFIFEKALNILNYIESKNVLLEIAKLYNDNNYYELALEEILRSIKVFDSIDRECAEILYFNFIK